MLGSTPQHFLDVLSQEVKNISDMLFLAVSSKYESSRICLSSQL